MFVVEGFACPTCRCLGNFATTMPALPCQAGIVATVTLDPDVTGLGWAPVVTIEGAEGPEVWPLVDELDDGDRAEEYARMQAHLGAGWAR